MAVRPDYPWESAVAAAVPELRELFCGRTALFDDGMQVAIGEVESIAAGEYRGGIDCVLRLSSDWNFYMDLSGRLWSERPVIARPRKTFRVGIDTAWGPDGWHVGYGPGSLRFSTELLTRFLSHMSEAIRDPTSSMGSLHSRAWRFLYASENLELAWYASTRRLDNLIDPSATPD